MIKKNFMVQLLIFAFSLHFFAFNFATHNKNFYNETDGGENLVAAFTLLKHNTFSINLEPHAGYKREPLYPFFLSTVMRVVKFVAPQTYNNFSFDSPTFNDLKILNVLLLYLTAFLAFRFLRRSYKNDFLALLGFLLILYSGALYTATKQYVTEIPAALLIFLVCVPYLGEWQKKSVKFFVLWGLGIAALILTKAVFLYSIFLVGIYWLVILKMNYNAELAKKMALFFLAAIIPVLTWMTRNAALGGGFEISGRKDEVLYQRALYDSMTEREYPFSYILWTPGLRKYFLTQENRQDWDRLYNYLGNDQLILTAFDKMALIRNKFGTLPNGSFPRECEKLITAEAMGLLKGTWINHIWTSFAFLYRSLYVEDGAGFEYFGIKLDREPDFDKRVDSVFLGVFSNLFYWVGFFGAIFFAMRFKKWTMVGFFILPLYLIFIHAFAAFSHFRYMQPLIPIFSISLVVFLSDLKKFKSTGQHAPMGENKK